MINRDLIYNVFPSLRDENFPGIGDFEKLGLSAFFPKGKIISVEGDRCVYFPFVIDGCIRVHKISESGREITLYRLEKGDSCILTASCILSSKHFPAISAAEIDTSVILIPSELILDWVSKYNFWRNYVFSLLSERLSAIIAVVEEIAFRNVDIRLIQKLIRLYEEQGATISTTHQALAADLGSSREVISRLLKDLEHENLLVISRGTIRILDLELLIKKTLK